MSTRFDCTLTVLLITSTVRFPLGVEGWPIVFKALRPTDVVLLTRIDMLSSDAALVKLRKTSPPFV